MPPCGWCRSLTETVKRVRTTVIMVKAGAAWQRSPWILRIVFVLYVASMILFAVGVLMQADRRELFRTLPCGRLADRPRSPPQCVRRRRCGVLADAKTPSHGCRLLKVVAGEHRAYVRFFGGLMTLIGAGMVFAVVTRPISEL